MALSGIMSNKWKGYTYQVSWSAIQNTSGNYSTITCTHKLICDSTWALDIYGRTITCTINSVNKTVSTSSINTGGGVTITLGTTTHTVNHSSNGAGSFSLSSTFPIQATIQGSYQSSISVSGSATLNTIPRASSMTVPEFTMGTAGTMNISKASTSFTHTITYVFGNKSGTIVSKTADTSVNWTPPLNDFASQLPNDTRGYGTLTLITYSGSTEVGRNAYVFYCNIPNSVVPTVGTITLTPTAINGNNILVQGKNKLTISVTGSSAGTGSSIKSYTFSGTGISTTTTSSSATINSISNSGTLTYTVKVTDSRGRVASKTATITCYGYSAPSFSTFEINRDSSNNIKCTYNVSYSSVNSTNKITVKFSYKKASGSWTDVTTTLSDSSKTNYTVLSNASDEVYNVRATVTDSYGASISSSTQTVFGSARIINVPQGGNGFSIGRKSTVASADAAGKFEVGWDATFDKNVNIGGKLTLTGGLSSALPITSGGTGATTSSGIAQSHHHTSFLNISPSQGTNGYVKLATFKITGTYVNQAIEIKVIRRQDMTATTISIGFQNTNATDPELNTLYCFGPALPYMHKSAVSTWDLYIQKAGAYDHISVLDFKQGGYSGDAVSVTWPGTLVTSLPSGVYSPVRLDSDYVISSGSNGAWTIRKWNNGTCECWRKITGTITSNGTWNNMKTFSGSADWPSNFFIENPNVQYQVYIGSGYAFPARGVLSTTTKFIWNALGSDGNPNIGYTVDVYAVGRWK